MFPGTQEALGEGDATGVVEGDAPGVVDGPTVGDGEAHPPANCET